MVELNLLRSSFIKKLLTQSHQKIQEKKLDIQGYIPLTRPIVRQRCRVLDRLTVFSVEG